MGMYSEAVQRLYVAYFNRPADPAGMAYWEQAIAAAQGSTVAVAAAFSGSDEYMNAYAGMDSAHIVNQVYLNLFGHNADAAGLDFWAKALTNKQMTVSDAVTQIASGAQGADLVAFQSKTAAASAFTNALDTAVEQLAYTGDTANRIAKIFLAGVVDEVTLKAATAPDNLQRVIDGLGGQPPGPHIFNLTPDVDHLIGTPGNDVFNAFPFNPATGFDDITLSGFDTVDGGAGNDVLNIQIASGRNTSYGTITNIETINITADVATDVDASAFSGAATLRQIGKAGVVYNLGGGTVAAFQGSTVTGAVEVNAAGSSATVFFENVSDSATLAVSGQLLSAVTVSGSRAHDGLGLAAALALTVTAGTDVQAVSVNTDQVTRLSIKEDAASAKHVTSVNAARSAGAIVFDGNQAPAVASIITGSGDDAITVSKVTGKALVIQAGAGNDHVYLSGAPESGDIIDGGSGNNTLVISGVDVSQAAAIGKLVTNFSAIQFVYPNSVSNLDASQLSPSYGTISLNPGGVITNVSTQSLIANGTMTATSAGYDGAGAYGNSLQITENASGTITARADNLNLTVNGISTGLNSILEGDLRAAIVTLAGDADHGADLVLATGSANLAGLKSLTLTGTGAADISNGDGSALANVNAAGLGSTRGLTYSSTNALAEKIYLSAGADHVALRASTYASADTVYGLKLVLNKAGTALAAASDTIVVGGVSASVKLFTTTQTDPDFAFKDAAASSLGDDLVLVLNGDTYIYHDNGNNLIDGADTLVKLAGVTDAHAVVIALGGNPG
jgi:trimeric autotransporter adhesin